MDHQDRSKRTEEIKINLARNAMVGSIDSWFLIEAINDLESKLKIAHEHLLDCFSQGTYRTESYEKRDEWAYDHGFLSAYENAQDYLVEQGMIDQKRCYRK